MNISENNPEKLKQNEIYVSFSQMDAMCIFRFLGYTIIYSYIFARITMLYDQAPSFPALPHEFYDKYAGDWISNPVYGELYSKHHIILTAEKIGKHNLPLDIYCKILMDKL